MADPVLGPWLEHKAWLDTTRRDESCGGSYPEDDGKKFRVPWILILFGLFMLIAKIVY